MRADALPVVLANAGNVGMVIDMQAAKLCGQAAALGVKLDAAGVGRRFVVQLVGAYRHQVRDAFTDAFKSYGLVLCPLLALLI